MCQRRLILASTSPWRQTLLARLGLCFEVMPPSFDESTGLPEHAGEDADRAPLPIEVARQFAIEKARSVVGRISLTDSPLVIGADQTLALAGDRLTKPDTHAEVVAQLQRLAGQTHELHSGVAVLDPQTGREEHEVTTVALRMRPLTTPEIEWYVAQEKTVGCVGGYTFEGRGIALFDEVIGPDESAIVGLPLLVLCNLLRRFDFDPLRVSRPAG